MGERIPLHPPCFAVYLYILNKLYQKISLSSILSLQFVLEQSERMRVKMINDLMRDTMEESLAYIPKLIERIDRGIRYIKDG